MGDHADAPFKSEYAKSGRASCKLCKSPIAKDTLRLAIMIQSPMFDGKQPNWYHFACFWKRARVQDSTEIHGLDALRWEDQEKVKKSIGAGGSGAANASRAGGDDAVYKDYAAEYAKSNRSMCRGCDEKIEKDAVRLSLKDFSSDRAKMYGPQDKWHHVDCFVEHREDLGFETDMQPEKIPGFKFLRKEDKDEAIEKLGKGSKKRKSEAANGAGGKKAKVEETEEEKQLKEQSQLLWKIRDNLSKEVANNALKILLEYNRQGVPSGESKERGGRKRCHSPSWWRNAIFTKQGVSKLLDRVSDCMLFGAIKPCTECKEGQLVASDDGYRCTGNMTEWTKCMHFTTTPARKAFKIPEEYHDVDFLKKYKYKKRDRVFPKVVASSSSGAVSSAPEGSRPLSGMMFVLTQKKKAKDDLTAAIRKLGGDVVSKVDKKVAAVISTKELVAKGGKVYKDAQAADIHVVDEQFVEAVSKGGAALLITQHSLCSWGSDPHERIDVVDGNKKSGVGHKSAAAARWEKESNMFTKSVPQKRKLTVKGGVAVDPDSGREEDAHVLLEKDGPFDAVLGMVDLVRGTNSFYKLQALESDKGGRFWLFRAWGRVGTTIGGNKVEAFSWKAGVVQKFKELYGEKTGNAWEDRKNFTKVPNKFYPLEIDYGGDDEEVKKMDISAGRNSKLASPVQDLVKMIFDVESMKAAMLEFEIDLTKMPLGKLSKNQIEKAFRVLTELNDLMDSAASSSAFLDASNRFYTLIPHDFGMKKPPLLDTLEIIKQKTDMLNNLLDIEVAYSLLKGGGGDEKEDILDVHYKKLKTDIQSVDKKSEEFEQLKTYVKNTHAATHNYYDLEIEEVYKLERDGEKKRFKPFKGLGNRKLLWHGSGVTNYVGILSQGLRIAPPEAPVTGYMFGKGVYFADMVSKSANYCRASKTNPTGLLLLCDVALGNMYELKGAKYVSELPKGKHSTKGLGMTAPDPSGALTTSDGMEIPLGIGTQSSVTKSSLLYNEYIVYDTAQIQMKYLLKLKYNYKW